MEDPSHASGLHEVMLDTYATVWIDPQPDLVRRRVRVKVDTMDREGRLRGTIVHTAMRKEVQAV